MGEWCEDRVIGEVWCGGFEVGLEFLAEGQAGVRGEGGEGVP